MAEPKSIVFRPEDLERLRESVDFFYSLYKLLHDGGGVLVPDTALAALMKPAVSDLAALVKEIENQLEGRGG